MGVVAAQSALSFVRVGHTVGLIAFRAAVTLHSRFGGGSVSSYSSLTPLTSVEKAPCADGGPPLSSSGQSSDPLISELEDGGEADVEMDSLLLPLVSSEGNADVHHSLPLGRSLSLPSFVEEEVGGDEDNNSGSEVETEGARGHSRHGVPFMHVPHSDADGEDREGDEGSRDECPPLRWFFDVDAEPVSHFRSTVDDGKQNPSFHQNAPLPSLRFVPLPLVIFGDGTTIDTAPISSPPPPLTSSRRCPLAVTAILRGHPSIQHTLNHTSSVCAADGYPYQPHVSTANDRVSSLLSPLFFVSGATGGASANGPHCDWCCRDCFVGRQQQRRRRVGLNPSSRRDVGDGVQVGNTFDNVPAARVTLAMSDFPLSVAAWGWASADGRLELESELGEGIFADGPFSAPTAIADVTAALISPLWLRLTCKRCWARHLGLRWGADGEEDCHELGVGDADKYGEALLCEDLSGEDFALSTVPAPMPKATNADGNLRSESELISPVRPHRSKSTSRERPSRSDYANPNAGYIYRRVEALRRAQAERLADARRLAAEEAAAAQWLPSVSPDDEYDFDGGFRLLAADGDGEEAAERERASHRTAQRIFTSGYVAPRVLSSSSVAAPPPPQALTPLAGAPMGGRRGHSRGVSNGRLPRRHEHVRGSDTMVSRAADAVFDLFL